jgi:hypothetical protein
MSFVLMVRLIDLTMKSNLYKLLLVFLWSFTIRKAPLTSFCNFLFVVVTYFTVVFLDLDIFCKNKIGKPFSFIFVVWRLVTMIMWNFTHTHKERSWVTTKNVKPNNLGIISRNLKFFILNSKTFFLSKSKTFLSLGVSAYKYHIWLLHCYGYTVRKDLC